MGLLTFGTGNLKLGKSDKNQKYLSCGLSLLPHKLSGNNVCPSHSPSCAKWCINWAGLGRLPSTQKARLNKTKYFFEDRGGFLVDLMKELHAFNRKCKFLRKKPVCRLNVFSDLNWEKLCPTIFTTFKDFQFMDYTKISSRYEKWLKGELPKNYYLVFSRSELNHEKCLEFLKMGGNVAMVFEKEIPKTHLGFKCINGDKNDLRFLDPKGTICALKSKGGARKDDSGFVIKDTKC